MGKQEDRAARQPHAVALRVLRQTLALAQFAHPRSDLARRTSSSSTGCIPRRAKCA